MARQEIAVTTAPGAHGGASAAVTKTAADTTNKEQFRITGRDLLLIHNTGGSSATWTATSVDDPYGRSEDITTESIAAGAIHVYGPTRMEGWAQTDGTFHCEASSTDVEFAVIRY